MKGVYQLPHATTTVASPCQTLRELLAWRRRVNAYSWPNPSIIGTMHEQCAEGLHFHDLPDRTPMECFVKICFREVSSFQVLYHCRVNSMISDIKGEGYSVLKNVTYYCVSIQYIFTKAPCFSQTVYMDLCICTGYNIQKELPTLFRCLHS